MSRKIEDMAINLIIDYTDTQTAILVDIQNDAGDQIKIGKRIEADDGLATIRITASDIFQHPTA